ncbi:MAG: hypothetical protein A2Z64_03600 [Betaproteobacteria bacterium RIFCSPLOWO2_02_67_12]|nr:MAG: hypothetical protein A2Z64_03600 [Betaproteobacteria bacterium RIFCSPLOWO2_02_67_12]OGA29460.1 MAG: hypothetical protein A3I65_09700 [Betaproteobacteria bacterium RIFCSPLOWO2_02_FULL_68_150]OGA55391.1 MAG: hypothetical protein A3F77_15575 [Betaproteobacteria bacterium RIFCSPLOWO2_12_FULL_67_28]
MSAVPVLRLELRPSRALAATILGAHLASAACLDLIVGGLAGMALAALAAALGAATAWDRALLRGARAPRAIELRGDGSASVESASGWRCPAAGGRGRAGRHWVIVALHGASRRTLLITGDMLETESFRRLRLWALWGRLPGAAVARFAA